MANKKLDARIPQKHDIEAHWKLATNFIPMEGEIIVYDPDERYDYARFKCGDGDTNVNDLPFFTDNLFEYINIGLSHVGNDLQLYMVDGDLHYDIETLLIMGGMPGKVQYSIVNEIPTALPLSGDGVYYVSIHRSTGVAYLDVGYGVMTIGQVYNAINQTDYEWNHGWTTDPAQEKVSGFYVLNKTTIVKDITNLPVTGDTDKIYRITTESKAELFYVNTDGNAVPYLDVLNGIWGFASDDGVTPYDPFESIICTIVNTLPTTPNETIPGEVFYVYILNSTGVGYVHIGGLGGWKTATEALLFSDIGQDLGWTTDVTAETTKGVYAVRTNDSINSSYHIYNGSGWSQLIDNNLLFETTTHISDTVSWNGNLDTFKGVVIRSSTEDGEIFEVKVSDSTPTVEEIGSDATLGYIIGTQYHEQEVYSVTENDGTIVLGTMDLNHVVIVTSTSAIASNDQPYPETGIYFVGIRTQEGEFKNTKLTIPGYDFVITAEDKKTIKPELISVDTTLTESGKPADAKAVGDKFATFETDLKAYIDETFLGGEW